MAFRVPDWQPDAYAEYLRDLEQRAYDTDPNQYDRQADYFDRPPSWAVERLSTGAQFPSANPQGERPQVPSTPSPSASSHPLGSHSTAREDKAA